MEDEAMMITPGTGSGTGRTIRSHPQLDKIPFGSKVRNFRKTLKYLKYLILRCPETRQRMQHESGCQPMNFQFRIRCRMVQTPLLSRIKAR
jgi:hypothetical protein